MVTIERPPTIVPSAASSAGVVTVGAGQNVHLVFVVDAMPVPTIVVGRNGDSLRSTDRVKIEIDPVQKVTISENSEVGIVVISLSRCRLTGNCVLWWTFLMPLCQMRASTTVRPTIPTATSEARSTSLSTINDW
jgi:hypothetical protein